MTRMIAAWSRRILVLVGRDADLEDLRELQVYMLDVLRDDMIVVIRVFQVFRLQILDPAKRLHAVKSTCDQSLTPVDKVSVGTTEQARACSRLLRFSKSCVIVPSIQTWKSKSCFRFVLFGASNYFIRRFWCLEKKRSNSQTRAWSRHPPQSAGEIREGPWNFLARKHSVKSKILIEAKCEALICRCMKYPNTESLSSA